MDDSIFKSKTLEEIISNFDYPNINNIDELIKIINNDKRICIYSQDFQNAEKLRLYEVILTKFKLTGKWEL